MKTWKNIPRLSESSNGDDEDDADSHLHTMAGRVVLTSFHHSIIEKSCGPHTLQRKRARDGRSTSDCSR